MNQSFQTTEDVIPLHFDLVAKNYCGYENHDLKFLFRMQSYSIVNMIAFEKGILLNYCYKLKSSTLTSQNHTTRQPSQRYHRRQEERGSHREARVVAISILDLHPLHLN